MLPIDCVQHVLSYASITPRYARVCTLFDKATAAISSYMEVWMTKRYPHWRDSDVSVVIYQMNKATIENDWDALLVIAHYSKVIDSAMILAHMNGREDIIERMIETYKVFDNESIRHTPVVVHYMYRYKYVHRVSCLRKMLHTHTLIHLIGYISYAMILDIKTCNMNVISLFKEYIDTGNISHHYFQSLVPYMLGVETIVQVRIRVQDPTDNYHIHLCRASIDHYHTRDTIEYLAERYRCLKWKFLVDNPGVPLPARYPSPIVIAYCKEHWPTGMESLLDKENVPYHIKVAIRDTM